MDKAQVFCEVAALAAKYDARDDIIWSEDLTVHAEVSDLFYWACGDYEEITEENLPILRQAIADVLAIDCPPLLDVGRAFVLFTARVRNLRPQGKYISDYLYVYQRDDETGRIATVWNAEKFNNATKKNGISELARNAEKTQQLKDLFLALPERPVDIGNPYTPAGSYEIPAVDNLT
jgi:hypothetical protein